MAKPPTNADSFLRPNVIRPADNRAAGERLESVKYRPELDPDNYRPLADSYEDSYWGSIFRLGEQALGSPWQHDKNFDPISKIRPGYEDYAHAFVYARNQEQVDLIHKQIDERMENRHRREARNGWLTLTSDLVSGIVDPSIAVAGPTVVGRGLVGGFVRGALGYGSIGAIQEAVNYSGDPTMTGEELAWRAGGAVVGSGVLLAPFGMIGAKGFKARMLTGTSKVSRYQSLNTDTGAPVLRQTVGQARQTIKARIATNESSGNMNARPRDKRGKLLSSARGIYQFTEGTWRDLGGDPAKILDRDEQERMMDKLLDKNQAALQAAGAPVTAGTLYLAHFLGSGDAIKVLKSNSATPLSGLISAKAIEKNPGVFKKVKTVGDMIGWASRKMGEASRGAERMAYDAYGASRAPKLVDWGENGIINVRDGPTGIIDENGRYRPAAFIHEKGHTTDEFTTVPVPERPAKFKNIGDVEEAPVPAREGRPVDAEIALGRRRVDVPAPPSAVRSIDDPADAAVELDRLDRGDALAVDASLNHINDDLADAEPFDGTVREYVRRYRRGVGRDDPEMLQFATNNAAEIEEEFQRLMRLQQSAQASDNLPFVSRETEMTGRSLTADEAAFMRGTVKAKGLVNLNQKELNQLGSIIYTLSQRDARAAMLWMGKSWDGRSPLKKNQIKGRLNQLVERRLQLSQKAPEYQRDIDSIFDPNENRQRLSAAMAEAVERRSILANRIDALRAQQKEDLAQYPKGSPVYNAANSEWRKKIELQRAILGKLSRVIEDIRDERNRLGNRIGVVDGYDATEIIQREVRDPETGRVNVFTEMTERSENFLAIQDEMPTHLRLFDQPEDLKELNKAQRAMDRMRERNGDQLRARLADKEAELMALQRDIEAIGRVSDEAEIEITWKSPEAEEQFNAVKTEIEEIENALNTLSSAPERAELQRQLEIKQRLLTNIERRGMVEISRGEIDFIEGRLTPKQQKLRQKLAGEIRDLDEQIKELEVYDQAHRDLLPFGIDLHGKEAPALHPMDQGGYLAIDTEALRASFPERPWTVGHDGVPGLPEDAFQTPEEWINFVYFHEREHVLNLRREDESLAEYETRINNRALALSKTVDAPWKPMDSWAEELALRPTPIGQVMHMVKNPLNYVYQSLARLASDYDLRLQRNLETGGASNPGGSVYQRTLKWQAKAVEYFKYSSDRFLEYRRGYAADGTIGRAVGIYMNRKAVPGKMSFEEFDKAIGKVQASGIKSGIKEVDDAAAKLNEYFVEIRNEMEALGMFRGKVRLEKELQRVDELIADIKKKENPSETMIEMLIEYEARREDIQFQLQHVKETAGNRGLPYFERVWNPAAILKDPDRFKQIVADGFMKPPEMGGLGLQAREAHLRAANIFDELTKDPTGTSIEVAAKSGAMRAREIPVENDEVLDFIHLNSSVILARYMRKTGAHLEMFRAFGDEAGDLEADRVLAGLYADDLPEEVVQETMQIWYDMRDRIIGGFHGENPMSTSNRMVRAVKRFTRIAVMGLSGISQIPDLFRSAWVSGPTSLAKGAFGPMIGAMQGLDPGKYAHAVGEALDIEMSILSRRMMEEDDWSFLTKETKVEKWLADVEIPFFIFNGVGPMTVMLKRAVARAAPHLALDRAIRVAEAIRAGKDAPVDDAVWLKEYGISEYDAMLLADLPRGMTDGGFMYVDLDEWAQLGRNGMRGKQLIEGMMSGHVRRSVATPGPLNRPRIMDGVMIDKQARKKAWEERWKLAQKEEEAREYVRDLLRRGEEEDSDLFKEAVEALKQAAGDHKRARLNVGSKARVERPLLSLPFQLQSFSMAQTGKLVHAVVSDRDKHRFIGMMSMWAAGIVSVWLKGLPIFTNANENASMDEFIMRGFSSSGLMSWFSIPWEGTKAIARLITEDSRFTNAVFGESRPGAGDDLGILGPGVGLGISGIEGLLGMGLEGSELSGDDRLYRLKRLIPFGNMLYFQWLTNMIFDQMGNLTSGDEEIPEMQQQVGQPFQPLDQSGLPDGIQKMMGFETGEQHTMEGSLPALPVEWDQQLAPTTEELMTDLVARVKKKGRYSKRKPKAKKIVGTPAFMQGW